MFEKQWESIVGNCDEFLYLGGNEQSTHEYVSKLLGKETIDTNTYGRSRGRNGSYSTNYQLAGRELMTPDEVRMECSEEASKELKKDCHRRQYIRDRNLETSFQVMSYSTMTFHDADICGEDVLEDKDCNVEEEVVQSLDIERVRTALKALTPEERDIIMNFYFSETPLSGEALAEKFATTKSSI